MSLMVVDDRFSKLRESIDERGYGILPGYIDEQMVSLLVDKIKVHCVELFMLVKVWMFERWMHYIFLVNTQGLVCFTSAVGITSLCPTALKMAK